MVDLARTRPWTLVGILTALYALCLLIAFTLEADGVPVFSPGAGALLAGRVLLDGQPRKYFGMYASFGVVGVPIITAAGLANTPDIGALALVIVGVTVVVQAEIGIRLLKRVKAIQLRPATDTDRLGLTFTALLSPIPGAFALGYAHTQSGGDLPYLEATTIAWSTQVLGILIGTITIHSAQRWVLGIFRHPWLSAGYLAANFAVSILVWSTNPGVAGNVAMIMWIIGMCCIFAFLPVSLWDATAFVATLIAAATFIIADGGPLADQGDITERIIAFQVAVGLALLTAIYLVTVLHERNRALTRFRGLLETTSDAYVALDRDGNIIDWNDAAVAMFGYSRAEAIGRHALDFVVPGERRFDFERLMSRANRSERSRAFSNRYVWEAQRADGSRFPVEQTFGVSVKGGRFYHTFLRDTTDRVRSEQRAAWLANHDSLTRLANRTSFSRTLDEMLARRLPRAQACVTLVEIDHFRALNERLGPAFGDAIIRDVADVLSKAAQDRDATVARVGAIDFALLFEGFTEDAARDALNDMVRSVRDQVRIAGETITVSCGLVAITDEIAASVDHPFAYADGALRKAKLTGGDRVAAHQPWDDIERGHVAALHWMQRLRWALEGEHFELHSMPIIALNRADDDPRRRVEFLLRMRSADGELISPDAFMEVAERQNAIADIDRWALRVAIEHLAQHPDLVGHVNVSARSLRQADFARTVTSYLTRYEVAPSRLVIEITETAALEALAQALTITESLHRAGVAVAIDDFGAGFAGIAYLQELHIDIIKLDSSLLRTVDLDRADTLIAAVIAMGHTLGKEIVAEGVETGEQDVYLRAQGVQWGQGFLYGRPHPASPTDATEGDHRPPRA